MRYILIVMMSLLSAKLYAIDENLKAKIACRDYALTKRRVCALTVTMGHEDDYKLFSTRFRVDSYTALINEIVRVALKESRSPMFWDMLKRSVEGLDDSFEFITSLPSKKGLARLQTILDKTDRLIDEIINYPENWSLIVYRTIKPVELHTVSTVIKLVQKMLEVNIDTLKSMPDSEQKIFEVEQKNYLPKHKEAQFLVDAYEALFKKVAKGRYGEISPLSLPGY